MQTEIKLTVQQRNIWLRHIGVTTDEINILNSIHAHDNILKGKIKICIFDKIPKRHSTTKGLYTTYDKIGVIRSCSEATGD